MYLLAITGLDNGICEFRGQVLSVHNACPNTDDDLPSIDLFVGYETNKVEFVQHKDCNKLSDFHHVNNELLQNQKK